MRCNQDWTRQAHHNHTYRGDVDPCPWGGESGGTYGGWDIYAVTVSEKEHLAMLKVLERFDACDEASRRRHEETKQLFENILEMGEHVIDR